MKSLARLAVLALAVLALAVPASADTMCASGSTCFVDLTFSNVSQLAGIDVQVEINNTGSDTMLDVLLVGNPVTNAPLGIDQFFYGSSTTISSVSEAGWSKNFDGGQADGFGKFLSLKSSNPAGTGGIMSPLIFTLNGLVTDFAGTSETGATFAAHLRYSGSCSGFAANAATGSITSNSNCTPLVRSRPNPLLCPCLAWVCWV